ALAVAANPSSSSTAAAGAVMTGIGLGSITSDQSSSSVFALSVVLSSVSVGLSVDTALIVPSIVPSKPFGTTADTFATAAARSAGELTVSAQVPLPEAVSVSWAPLGAPLASSRSTNAPVT